jgi:preprotein translocase subunit SecE
VSLSAFWPQGLLFVSERLGNVSDRSPRESPEETPQDDSTLDETPETQETAPEAADIRAEGETDDEVIARLDEGLPEDESLAGPAPIRRRTAQAPVKKAAPTRKRSDALKEQADPYKAKNPAHFVRQSGEELKKVVWPTWPALVRSFFAVLAFVLFIITVVALLDAAFGWALLKILGSN